MPERFAKLFDDLPYLLGGHLMLSKDACGLWPKKWEALCGRGDRHR